jgi:hypothetical protein
MVSSEINSIKQYFLGVKDIEPVLVIKFCLELPLAISAILRLDTIKFDERFDIFPNQY